MEISTMIKLLQDPMGIPFYPVLFQVLMVLTFALHIMFVNFVLGTSFLSVYGYIKGDDYWKRLSKSMIRATTANISMAILLGVAPLLFVQVVYDPFWYASNMISGAWVMAFILIMMLGYSMVYVFYLKRDSRGRGFALFGIGALALFILAGIIMHVLGYQLLQPEKWFGWYINGNSVNTSGTALHTFHTPRFLHFMIPSFALTGVFLMLYAWYFKDRADTDKEYLQWIAKIGAKMAFVFTAIQAGVGFWWLFSLPLEFKFFINPFFLVGAGLGVSLLFFLNNAQKDPIKYAVPAIIGTFLTIFGMSYTREALRMTYLSRFDYSIFNYKLNIDFGSTALFLSTFVTGLIIAGYLLTIAYKSGKVTGEYVPSSAIDKWGKISIALLLVWIAVVVTLGVVISVKNYL
ncbi:MAG: hypothetical protein HY957_07580 [Nitrospirae bacterium]|nr:hypothetical protein [Nitrospirota bacterium]